MRLSVLLCFSSIPPRNLSILSENFLVSFCSNTDNLNSADWKVVPVKEKLQNNPHLRAQTCGEHIPLAMEEQHKAMKQHKTKKSKSLLVPSASLIQQKHSILAKQVQKYLRL